MAEIHRTTLSPTKLELLTSWLPSQSWYRGGGSPELSRAGGFRLDDPAGEVGVELLVVQDTSSDETTHYLVPMTYRGAPLVDADDALIGTSEHGVLGTRWVYDGVHDPVLVAAVLALVQGEVEAQAQSLSNTVDPCVVGQSELKGLLAKGSVAATLDACTVITVDVGTTEAVTLHLVRDLGDGAGFSCPHETGNLGRVSASWPAAEGTALSGHLVAVVRVG